MKKLFILFIIIINTSFFYDIYKKYQSIDISVFSGAINLQNADLDVTFEQTIYENNIEFINNMTQLADKYNITVVKRHIDIDQNMYQYYLYTNENINDLCDAIVYDKIDFHSLNEKNYYSNISKDDFSKKIFSLDYSSIINIKPFSYLYNNHDIVGDYSFKGKNVEKFVNEIGKKYKIINKSFAESVDEQIEDETTSIEMNYTMLLICVVILFLILFGWLIKNKKIHSIYYLQGISHFCMIKDLYLKTFIVSMLCCLIVPVILFFVFVGEINSFTIHIVQSLWQISFLEIIVLIILLFILYLYLIFNSKIDGIHGKRGLKLFLNVNYVMKIVSLLILVPLVIQYANELMNEYYYNRYMIKNYEGIEDYMNIYTMDYSYMDLNYNQAEAAFGEVNPTILEYQHYYDLLEKQGAITFMYQPLNIGINEFVVNYQYLLQFPIQDTKGEILDLDLDTSSCFLLVPESLKDIDTEQFKKERDMNIKKVIVNDKQDYFRNLDAVSIEQLNNQNIIFVYGKQYNIGRRNPYDYIYIQKTIDEVDNIVKGSRFEGTLKYRTLQDYIDNTQLRSPYYLFENTAVIILTLLLLIGILYENYCFYINLNMKQVMIKKMLGHRKIDIFKDLYLELMICYLPIFVFYRNNILIPVLLFVFDGILHFYISHYIYAKKTMNYLKGE